MRHVSLVCCIAMIAGAGMFAEEAVAAPSSRISGLAYDGEFVYLSTDVGFRTIYRLDPRSLGVVDSFRGPSESGLDGRNGINELLAADGGRLFVVAIAGLGAPDRGRVYEIASDGSVILDRFELPFRGGGLASDGKRLYIGDFDGTTIRVTTLSGHGIDAFDTDVRPAGLAYDFATGTLWAISQFNGLLHQLSLDGELLRTCTTPRLPDWYQGAVTFVDDRVLIAESSTVISDETPGTIHVLSRRELDCTPPLNLPVSRRPG